MAHLIQGAVPNSCFTLTLTPRELSLLRGIMLHEVDWEGNGPVGDLAMSLYDLIGDKVEEIGRYVSVPHYQYEEGEA